MSAARRLAPKGHLPRLETLEDRCVPSATLLKDINLSTADGLAASDGAYPGPGATSVAVGNTAFFAADDGKRGLELFKSDGTAAGTVMVKDINTQPGYFGALNASSLPTQFTRLNNKVFFVANDGVHGSEVWVSDGTAAGTKLVKDVLQPLPPGQMWQGIPTNLTAVNGLVYYSVPLDVGTNFYRTDGTDAGTALVGTYFYSPSNPMSAVGKPVAFQGATYFAAGAAGSSRLFMTDGPAAGTVAVADVEPAGEVAVYNGRLYFAARSPTAGYELFSSDGTAAGTAMVKDISPTTGSYPSSFTVANGLLFFTAYDDVSGAELWVTDGTEAGTRMVNDLFPGGVLSPTWPPGVPSAAEVLPNSSSPTSLTALGNQLYFVATTAEYGVELWKTDGTAAGTSLVKDINTMSYPTGTGSSFPRDLTVVGNSLYFTADDGPHGVDLYRTGAGGTALVKDLPYYSGGIPGIPFPGGSSVGGLVAAGNTLMFAARDPKFGMELWKSNGTAGGTAMVTDINRNTLSASPGELVTVGGWTYFAADDGVRGVELWKTNGTPGGTVLVKDLLPGGLPSTPRNLVAYNGKVYFVASDQRGNARLYKSDGTAAGTAPVGDFDLVPEDLSFTVGQTGNLTIFQGKLAFTHARGNTTDLYVTNGTAGGTTRLARFTLTVGMGLPAITGMAAVNHTLYFTADDGIHGVELWKTNGTAAGTVLVKDIQPGVIGSTPARLTAAGNKLFFTANDGENGTELWKSDGTAAGTTMLADINAGSSDAFWYSPPMYPAPMASPLLAVGNVVYFAADGGFGEGLWKSDGTAAGTVMVKDIAPGASAPWPGLPEVPTSSQITELTNVNGVVYFSATDGVNGVELWKTDGTADGTVMVKDIYPGSMANPLSLPGLPGMDGIPFGSFPRDFTFHLGHVYFTAENGASGRELWVTDGTAAGTRLAMEITAGPGSGISASLPGSRVVWSAAGKLFLAGFDAVRGNELWTYSPPVKNRALVARAGGPYVVLEGKGLALNAGASFDADGDALRYSWDLNGDGVFGDARGASPVVSWGQLWALGLTGRLAPYRVKVRVEDGRGGVAESSASLAVKDQPLWGYGLSLRAQVGKALTGAVAVFGDLGGAEKLSNYSARIDWADGTPGTGGQVKKEPGGPLQVHAGHTFTKKGTYKVKVTLRDDSNLTLVLTTTVVVA